MKVCGGLLPCACQSFHFSILAEMFPDRVIKKIYKGGGKGPHNQNRVNDIM